MQSDPEAGLSAVDQAHVCAAKCATRAEATANQSMLTSLAFTTFLEDLAAPHQIVIDNTKSRLLAVIGCFCSGGGA